MVAVASCPSSLDIPTDRRNVEELVPLPAFRRRERECFFFGYWSAWHSCSVLLALSLDVPGIGSPVERLEVRCS